MTSPYENIKRQDYYIAVHRWITTESWTQLYQAILFDWTENLTRN